MTDIVAPAAGGQGEAPPAAPASAAATLTAPQAPAAPVAAPTWLEGADPTLVGYVQNKGWSEPKQVLDSYVNLEKLLGADRAGNTVVMPKVDALPQELDAFYNRLGRPSDPAGYKIPVPEGVPPDFANAAAAKMHELGLTQKAGETLGSWWNEQAKAAQAAQQTELAAKVQADDAALKKDWGAAFDQNRVIAQNAARALGVDAATIEKMQEVMGLKATMEHFHKIGSKMGEPEFVSGETRENFGAALTPGQAQAKINELKGDKNFVARYVNHDAAAVAEMARLHAFAFPEGS